MDREKSSDDTWCDPVDVVPLKAGYDWRAYSVQGHHMLCLNGRPLEVQGKFGNWWRACSFEPAGNEVYEFAAAMRGDI